MSGRSVLPGFLALLAVISGPVRADVDLWDADAGIQLKAAAGAKDDGEATWFLGGMSVIKTVYAAAANKTVEDYVAAAAKVREKSFLKSLESQISRWVKEENLDADTAAKLKEMARPAAEAAVKDWTVKARGWAETTVTASGGEAKVLESWRPEQMASLSTITGWTPPEETEVWKNALKANLTPERLEAFKARETEARNKILQEYADYLSASGAHVEEAMKSSMETVLQSSLEDAESNDERRKQLKEAGDQAVKATLARWRARAEKQLLEMDPKVRENTATENGLIGANMADRENQPAEEPVWKEALARLFSEEERTRIAENRRQIRARRAESLAMALIGELDRSVGFSEKQREELLKCIAPRMSGLPPSYFERQDPNTYYNLDVGTMMREAAKGLGDEVLKTLLDEGQRQRWRKIDPDSLSGRGRVIVRRGVSSSPVAVPVEEADPMHVERQLSEYLHKEAREMARAAGAMMEAQVESVRRVAAPSDETVGMLRTAARGAAEEIMRNNVDNLASWVRNQFRSVRPQDISERLRNLHNPYYNERALAAEPALWTSTVARLLTEPQRAAWKVECDARELWRKKGMIAMVVTDVEKHMRLSPGQREKLTEKLLAALTEYETEINNFFSFTWHLQSYYASIPLAMLTDAQMAELFDEKERETIKEQCLGQTAQYADMIRQNRKHRN